MQSFRCPFCGPRPETEFRFATEAGRPRPEGAVSDAAWAAWLYEVEGAKGPVREVWLHLTCGEFFVMERDTVTRAVIEATPLPEAGE